MNRKWDLETMNQYCNEQNIDYKVLKMKWIEKTYQKQLWVLIKCPNKNHEEYWVNWNAFKRGNRCKLCYYEKNNKTMWNKNKVKEFYNSHNLNIVNINDFKSVDKSILCIDKNGFKVFASIINLKGGRTPSPFQYNKYALDNIKLYCKLYRSDYEIISDKYDKIKTQYLWRYIGNNLPKNINPIFKQTADGFINGGCGHPYFSRSQGNRYFENELIKNNINYIREKKFKGCKDKILLRFDFYIPNINQIIEIDGLQHSQVIDYFGGKEGYEDRIRKDNIKNNYCRDNNIKIIRIPYETKKIEIFKELVDSVIESIKEQLQLKITKE